jgi:hypothetical protein
MTNNRPGMIRHDEYWRLPRSLHFLVVRIAELLRKWLRDFSKNKNGWRNDSTEAILALQRRFTFFLRSGKLQGDAGGQASPHPML